MLLEEREELFLKRHPLMMGLLPRHIIDNALAVRLADAESAVAGLPTKTSLVRMRVMDPTRRVRLEYPHEIRQGYSGG